MRAPLWDCGSLAAAPVRLCLYGQRVIASTCIGSPRQAAISPNGFGLAGSRHDEDVGSEGERRDRALRLGVVDSPRTAPFGPALPGRLPVLAHGARESASTSSPRPCSGRAASCSFRTRTQQSSRCSRSPSRAAPCRWHVVARRRDTGDGGGGSVGGHCCRAARARAERIDRCGAGRRRTRHREPECRVLDRVLRSRDPLAVALVFSSALAFVDRRARLGGRPCGARRCRASGDGAAGPRRRRARAARRAQPRGSPAAPRPPRSSRPRSCSRCSCTPATINDWRFALILPIALGALVLVTRAPPDVLRYGAVASVALMAVVLLDLDRDRRRSGRTTDRSSSSRLSRSSRSSATATRVPRRSFVVGGVLLLGGVYLVVEPCARPVLRSAPSRRRARGRSRACGPSWSIPRSRDRRRRGRGGARSASPRARQPRLRHVPRGRGRPRETPRGRSGAPRDSGARRVRLLASRAARQTDAAGESTARSLLDAAQRLYEPRLTADGRVVAGVGGTLAFSPRPDLEIDTDPAVLVVRGRW